MNQKNKGYTAQELKKMAVKLFILYICLAVAFYYLAGEQLRIRDSRGNISMGTAQTGAVELVEGTVVEQTFTPEIQRLNSVAVQFGTYMRSNAGTVTIQLLDARDSTCLLEKQVNAAEITEGMVIELTAQAPIEKIYGVPMIIRITADSVMGSGVCPLVDSTMSSEGESLRVNGTAVDGTLCFSASGEDYIWTGLHYWKFVAGGACILVLSFFWIGMRLKNGKRSYVINAMVAIRKYRFLIRQLVARDFKTKYKRSVLGVLWSFLNPLLTMLVQYFVFSTIFRADIPNYPVYLLIGIIMFNFFSESCGMSLTSILGNASLITKVYVPKYIYPLTRVISSVINLAISLLPLLLVMLFTGTHLEKSAILAFFFLGCLVLFCLGLGMLLSAMMVFFRDTQFLWNVCSMLWMYATPIFYPESILPEQFHVILNLNPLYYFLKCTRMCVLDGISPEPILYVVSFLIAIAMLLVGSWIFNKTQDRFVLYL